MSLQLVLEDLLQVGDCGLLVVLMETARLPGVLFTLDDEGRVAGRVLIRVHAPQSRRRLLEVERERRERHGRAEPDETVAAPIEVRLELIRQRVADPARDSVGSDDQIGCAQPAIHELSNLLLPVNLDAECLRPPGEQLEQRPPLDPGEPMASRPMTVPR